MLDTAEITEGRILRARIIKRAARLNVPSRNRFDEFTLVFTCEAAEGPDFSDEQVVTGERTHDTL